MAALFLGGPISQKPIDDLENPKVLSYFVRHMHQTFSQKSKCVTSEA